MQGLQKQREVHRKIPVTLFKLLVWRKEGEAEEIEMLINGYWAERSTNIQRREIEKKLSDGTRLVDIISAINQKLRCVVSEDDFLKFILEKGTITETII